MKTTFAPTAFVLATLAQLSIAQDPSALFSQYIGATTATADFTGSDAIYQSEALTGCTNFLHGIAAIPTNLPESAQAPLEQVQVDDVCQFCTSVQQSRVDSCCAVSTSVECFDQFKSGAKNTPASAKATTTPASNSATITGSAASNTATVTGAAPASTSKSNGEKVDVSNFAGSVLAILGFVRWFL